MKYGVIWRKTTKNIGDDIQSYAQSLFMPQVDYMIDIEELDSFKSDNDEPVAAIMSSWYMWQKWNWPPSKDIYPLWVGLHYNDIQRGRPRGMPSKWEYVDNGPGLEYLKAYEPIGCRDYYTQDRLDNLGIKNYYSGCITLTLPKREIKKPEKEYIVVVGVDKPTRKYIQKFYENTDIEVKVVSPTRPEPSTNMSWEERKAEVEELLDLYQNAKGVVTFRLHCALPTLALGTPVLLVRPSFKSVRFNPYADYVNTAHSQEVLDGKFDEWLKEPFENPETFKPIREQLTKTATQFIEKAKAETRTATELKRTSYTDEDVLLWQHKTMKLTLHNYHIEHHIDLTERNRLKKELAKLEKQNEKLSDKLDEYKALGSPKSINKKLSAYNNLIRRFPIRVMRKLFRIFKKKPS